MAGDLVRTQIQDGVAGLTLDFARGKAAVDLACDLPEPERSSGF